MGAAQADRPLFLRQLSTDEYRPMRYSERDVRVIDQVRCELGALATSRRTTVAQLSEGRLGTAVGLRSLNDVWADEFYAVPLEAALDDDAASAIFSGHEAVVDVQTHFMAPRALRAIPHDTVQEMYRAVMPDWWKELDSRISWDLARFVRDVFLRTENCVAVLTSGPGLDDWRTLFNDEMAATRALIEGFGGTGRLLIHSVVHADVPDELAAMEAWRDEFRPAGWKVYTMGRVLDAGWSEGWMLDDETGIRFLERARDLGPRLICVHKGISALVDNGSPRDVGPAARMFPELNFLVYHSGYEFPGRHRPPGEDPTTAVMAEHPHEGPYTEATSHIGVNRLLKSLDDAGVPPGANVYAELGTTWFSLIRNPVDASHVLGKLIKRLGEDNVIWGTDSIWYGAAQPLIDAFRVFQIPERMCDEFGYSPLTPAIKEKILGLNAARVYGFDLNEAKLGAASDDLVWAAELLMDYQANGFSALR